MKTSKIGQLNFEKFETEIFATEEVKKEFKSEKVSMSTLIPVAWNWYDSELMEVIDENGDGKPDDKFGTKFKIIYLMRDQSTLEFEKDALIMERIKMKNIHLKYVGLKNA